jgi:ribonuclease P/MRP protein subunit RPP40
LTSQFGARKGRSTTHALNDITHKLQQALGDQNSARCLFIDFTKAFDHVAYTIVLKKLPSALIIILILRWLHSFLFNRQQRVKIDNVTSQWTSLSGGMPQGTWLGPYVFLALIDNLHALLLLHKFVDDVTVTEVIVPSTASQKQQTADQITQWFNSNHMIINKKKAKEMLFGSQSRNNHHRR